MDMRGHFALALVVRLALIAYGCFQDAYFEVKYTDVDYHVFTDAARYVSEGRSPFERHTYRYTPLLAFLVLPNVLLHPVFGKVLFALFDLLTSVLLLRIQTHCGFTPGSCRASVFLWLYNPLPCVVSTRGSAESVMTFLVALCVSLCQAGSPAPLGLLYGLSVHLKIYPCIYAPTLYFAVDGPAEGATGWSLLRPSLPKVTFVLCSALGFLAPTLLSLLLYEGAYLQEALLYHLTRKDIRHNFSPYFYLLYLMESQATNDHLSLLVSALPFLIQALLVTSTSVTLRRSLPSCMFVQTFLFVTFNKVCTSQYFMWYLCLFAMTYPLIVRDTSSKVKSSSKDTSSSKGTSYEDTSLKGTSLKGTSSKGTSYEDTSSLKIKSSSKVTSSFKDTLSKVTSSSKDTSSKDKSSLKDASSSEVTSSKVMSSLVMWMAGQGLWLLAAYSLEFQGRRAFVAVHVASLVFFLINVCLVCRFVRCVRDSLDVCTMKKTE